MLASMPFANGLRGPTTTIRMPTLQMRAVESISVVGDTLVASPVRVPVITWTEGIEVSHQGVAIASAYAGTTRVIVMMSSGPMPNGVPTPSPRSQELIDILAPGGQPIGVRLGGARDSIRTLPGGEGKIGDENRGRENRGRKIGDGSRLFPLRVEPVGPRRLVLLRL